MEYSASRHGMRGFPVEFAALGFLIEEPMHGYALRTRIEEGLGPLWQVASSQLYQVLHRLEEQGYVLRSSQTPSVGPSKMIYQVTADGDATFWIWAQEPVHTMRTVRVEFAAKLYFLRRLRLEAAGQLIAGQLAELEAMEDYVTSERKKGSDDGALNEAWLAFQVATINNFRQWLTAYRKQLSTHKENDS